MLTIKSTRALGEFAVLTRANSAMLITAVFGSLNYCSFAYSAFACFRMGISGSAPPAEKNFGGRFELRYCGKPILRTSAE